MSVRAYRIIEIKHKEDASFNLWAERELAEFLEGCDFYEHLNTDGVGVTEVSVEDLEEALSTLTLSEDTKEALKRDIAAGQETGYVSYYCY